MTAGGIGIYFTDAGISIYPNPANTKVNVEINIAESSNIEFTLMDFVGQTLIERNLNFITVLNNTTIDLLNFSNGIYLLKIKKDNSIYKKKIVINN